MSHEPINFQDKLGLFDDHWAPRVIAEMNDYQFKLVKIQGDFVWHDHPHTDETRDPFSQGARSSIFG